MSIHSMRASLACAGSVAVLLAAAGGAQATWSIIMTDSETKEIAIGSCTCLTNFDLRENTPVMIVGIGGATAQGLVDSGCTYRMQIHDFMVVYDMDPADIINIITGGGNAESRQFGIVDTQGRPATFTGSSTNDWAGGTVGSIGTLTYAVQGNILPGAPVVGAAVAAIHDTPGDLAEKLMASMEAAYLYGGDGRCSCPPPDAPTDCGAPPDSFDKSAHIGYMLVSRLGDTDDFCDCNGGCARGDYYMNLNVPFQQWDDPDPVLQLRDMYDAWRLDQQGRPDGLLSTVELSSPYLTADGESTVGMTVHLLDIDGAPVTEPVASFTVAHDDDSAGAATIGPIVNFGDGVYSITLQAGSATGADVFKIIADDGIHPVQLSPPPTLIVRLPGDVNADGAVDQADLGLLLATYELPSDDALFNGAADFDGDGAVTQSDLGVLLANYEA
ncbi:MAG: DUF1028 domain-containing protein [Phycisphaerales bacterium JB038]